MLKGFMKYLSNFKNVLKLLVLCNLLFLIIYKLFLHSYLIEKISNKDDAIDIKYYTGIFNKLDYAVIIVTVIILLLLILYNRLKKILLLPNRTILIICIVSTIVIQFALQMVLTTIPISDSKHYIDNANLLYETGSYINSAGNLTAFWTVGLPAYLAVLKSFSQEFISIAKIINIIFSAGFILSCYFIFKSYLTPIAINIFLIIFTFFPNNLLSANIILTDYPFAFFLWTSILILLVIKSKPSVWLAALMGTLCALGSFLRPIGIGLTIIFCIAVVLNHYPLRWKKSLVVLSVFILLMLPWGIRNFNLFHSIVPVSTNGGFIFLMGNHENSSGGVNFDFEYDIKNPDEVEESRKAYTKGFSDILKSPFQSLVRIPKKILQTYYRSDSVITWGLKQTEEHVSDLTKSTIFYSSNLFFYIIILLNVYVLIDRWRMISYKKYGELIIISIYIFLILIVSVGSERYHIPLIPVHVFLAAKYFEKKTELKTQNNNL